jgi:hypothetical protein
MEQQQALRILARHVVSQLELRRRAKQLGDVRAEGARLKDELERTRAELAAARRELPPEDIGPTADRRARVRTKRK